MFSEQATKPATSHSSQSELENGVGSSRASSKKSHSASCILRADIVDAAFSDRSIYLRQDGKQSSSVNGENPNGRLELIDDAIPGASISLHELDSHILENLAGHLAHLENQCVKLRSLLDASR